nr:hypothetical protein BaRGS_002544 [Batillaria attramentaria]
MAEDGVPEPEDQYTEASRQLKTVLKLIDDLRVVPPLHRVTMVRIVKDVTLETILRLRGHTAHTGHDTQRQSEGNLWGKSLGDIVRVAYSSAKVKDGDMWQSALLRRLEKRVAHDDDIFFKLFLKRRIHALQWAFLEALGYFTFLGMLLVRCESYRAELAMCLITVISISLLCYLVADLDSPFHGFFRVDLHCYDERVLMIPGTAVCQHAGWNVEYSGHLMSGHHTHAAATEYVCVDSAMETAPGSGSDQNGKLFYYVAVILTLT